MILHILDPCQNKVKVTRAILCQAVLHCTNVRAKEAASSGKLLDLKTTGELLFSQLFCVQLTGTVALMNSHPYVKQALS